MAGSISTLGVGSGLELQSILDQLRAVDQQVVTRQETEVASLTTRLDTFTEVNNKLLSMKSFALDLSLASGYFNRTVSSSDETVMTATVIDGTAVQNSAVTVERLASKSAWLATGMESEDSKVNTAVAGVFRYSLGGKTVSVAVPGDTTLGDLADLINNDKNNAGVSAKIVDSGSGANRYQLFLQADKSGSDNSISMLEVPNLMAMNRQEASAEDLNAKLVVDKVTYYRQNNSVSDVMPGVTLSLQKTGDASITVGENNDSVIEKITGLVTSYNDVVQHIGQNTGYDEKTGQFGSLARSTARSLPFLLQNLMTSSVVVNPGESGAITSLFDIGLEFNRDGTITINAATLKGAVNDNLQGVQDLFLGDPDQEITGLADLLNDSLREITGGTGQIAAEKTTTQERIDGVELKIEADTQRINKKYDMLTKQFVALDSYMKRMTSMADYLTGQFKSISDLASGSNSSG